MSKWEGRREKEERNGRRKEGWEEREGERERREGWRERREVGMGRSYDHYDKLFLVNCNLKTSVLKYVETYIDLHKGSLQR